MKRKTFRTNIKIPRSRERKQTNNTNSRDDEDPNDNDFIFRFDNVGSEILSGYIFTQFPYIYIIISAWFIQFKILVTFGSVCFHWAEYETDTINQAVSPINNSFVFHSQCRLNLNAARLCILLRGLEWSPWQNYLHENECHVHILPSI